MRTSKEYVFEESIIALIYKTRNSKGNAFEESIIEMIHKTRTSKGYVFEESVIELIAWNGNEDLIQLLLQIQFPYKGNWYGNQLGQNEII